MNGFDSPHLAKQQTSVSNISANGAGAELSIFWQSVLSSSPPPIEGKDLFDWSHNPSHSILYPDVLKIKTMIFVKQNFAKMPFVYYLQIHFWQLWSWDVLAAGLSDYRCVNNKQMAFLQIFVHKSQQLSTVFSLIIPSL